MKTFVSVLFLIFCISCSNRERTSDTKKPQLVTENETPVSHSSTRKVDPPPPPPPPPTSQTKSQKQLVKEQEQSKVENEVTSMKDVIKRMLEEYNDREKTWIKRRSLDESQFMSLKKKYVFDCEKQPLDPSTSFNQDYTNRYENSSIKTGKIDGKIFCLHNLMESEGVIAKLLYNRNEGGHATDGVYIFTMNEDSLQTLQLYLYVEYARDGYHSKVESNFSDPTTINRNVREMFGWRAADDKDVSLQPFVETKQIFKLLEDGSIRKTSEEVIKHNFERYLD